MFPSRERRNEEYVAKKSELCESIFQFLWPCIIYEEQSRNIIKLSSRTYDKFFGRF